MIVTVKSNGPKKQLMKIISFVALIAMFTAYYFHMSEEFSGDQALMQEQTQEQKEQEDLKENSKKIERIIFKEVETAVDLVGQEYIQDVKIVKNRILIVCDTGTNLDPLKVRYGTLALIKNDLNNIKIAIDIKYIIESKLNDEK